MNLIKMIRKFVKILIGGSGSKEIYLAFLFGIILGLTPGYNLTSTILILLIIIINVNLGTAVIAFLLGEIIMYLITPITYNIGYFLIHSSYLNSFFQTLVNAPVSALLGFDNYCLVGGIITGIIIGLIFAWIFTYIVQVLRKALLIGSSQKTISKIASNPIVKFVLRIIFGKQKNNIEETFQTKSKLIRKGFFYPLIIFVIILIIADLFLISPLTKSLLVSKAENVTGAEVNIESLNLSILKGKLKLKKLEITDATNPEYNLIYIEDLEAQLNITELLAKRLVADKAILKGASTNTKRVKPGKIYTQKKLDSPKVDIPDLKSDSKIPEITGNILDKIKKGKKYIETVQKYFKIVSEKYKSLREPAKAKKSKKHSDLLTSTAVELVKAHPAVLFKEISGDSSTPYPLDLKILNISTEPELVQDPVKIYVIPKDKTTSPNIELILKTSPKSDYVNIKFNELLLNNIKIADGLPSLKKAKANINAKGTFNEMHVNIPCTITLKELQMDRKIHPGIDLNSLEELKLFFNITGSLDKISIIPDHNKNTQSVKNILTHRSKKIIKENLNNIINDNDTAKDIKNKVFDIFK